MPSKVYDEREHYLSWYDKKNKICDFYIVMLPVLCWRWGVETRAVDVFFYQRHDGGIHSPHNKSIWEIRTKQIPIDVNNCSRPEPSIIYAHLEEVMSADSKMSNDFRNYLQMPAESFFEILVNFQFC